MTYLERKRDKAKYKIRKIDKNFKFLAFNIMKIIKIPNKYNRILMS